MEWKLICADERSTTYGMDVPGGVAMRVLENGPFARYPGKMLLIPNARLIPTRAINPNGEDPLYEIVPAGEGGPE